MSDQNQYQYQYTYNDHAYHPDPPHQPLYLTKVLKALRADPSVVTVLDAGCGDGNFGESLANEGYDVFGIDMSEAGIRRAQQRGVGTFALGSVYEPFGASFAMDHFDAVLAVEVVEHLYSPRIFAKNAFDALRPGGRVIVTTPYWGYWKNLALAVSGQIDRLHTALWDGGHIKHWSKKTVTVLLEEQGFDVVAFTGAGRAPYLWKGMMVVGVKPT